MFEKLEEQLRRYNEIEGQLADPAVVQDTARYAALGREYGSLGRTVARFRRYKEIDSSLTQAREMLADPDMKEMAEEEIASLEPRYRELQEELTDILLTDPEDLNRSSLIVEIRAGTGGEEASLFARDLFDMYQRYAEMSGWKVETLEFSVSETKGFKEVIFSVSGQDCFRKLQFESGGHRVQRVPETETQGRIHTSAATVAVLAEPEDVELEIRPEDINFEATRASGPGGQHVNKTSSAVRLTHIPTGTVVFCQEERSQHKNRAKAMRVLKTRIYEKMQRDARQQRDSLRRTLIGSGDRSERIRTYNFPQNRCTDHRIGENFNLEEVVAGKLDKLVSALLAFDRNERLDALNEKS